MLSAFWLSASELNNARVGLPLVLLGERAADATVDHVGIDNVAAAREITQHLIDGGRTRIAAILEHDHPRAPTSQQRLKGYLAALTAAGLRPDPELVARIKVYPQRQDGADAMARLLAGRTRPDAVFCFSDMVATGVLRKLHLSGLRVPHDVAVVSFDDVDECRFTAPALSTVAPDKTGIARRALELLAKRIDGYDGPAQDVRIPYRLALRESSACGDRHREDVEVSQVAALTVS